jgi:hypothetical protein
MMYALVFLILFQYTFSPNLNFTRCSLMGEAVAEVVVVEVGECAEDVEEEDGVLRELLDRTDIL